MRGGLKRVLRVLKKTVIIIKHVFFLLGFDFFEDCYLPNYTCIVSNSNYLKMLGFLFECVNLL